ncbi:hypothetical protein MRS44_005649 [Fusarium solani]|uniref:uncharacterized protein n=1 Tax=Fusarium solani TaxID=169388 RepID=UPI0032C44E68|nr:hypothetical protein MRS44_005649 [Fusarium solani]
MAASTPPQASISALCGTLQTATARAIDALRDFVIYYPSARLDLASLSRELAELQMVSRLLHHNAETLDAGTATLPQRLEAALRESSRRRAPFWRRLMMHWNLGGSPRTGPRLGWSTRPKGCRRWLDWPKA